MLSDDDVREILRIIDTTPLAELRIETEGFALHVRRGQTGRHDDADRPRHTDTVRPRQTQIHGDELRAVVPTSPRNGLLTIEAPMLGTFYQAESPGAQPFVSVGSRVEPDTTVCIIEVMKMMNSVPAGVAGTVTEICATDAELVEYGAPLFRVEPA